LDLSAPTIIWANSLKFHPFTHSPIHKRPVGSVSLENTDWHRWGWRNSNALREASESGCSQSRRGRWVIVHLCLYISLCVLPRVRACVYVLCIPLCFCGIWSHLYVFVYI
jgi:hypothetical protein